MNQEISLAGVLPIHTGRGEEANRRKADDRGGQNLTAQYINHTESAVAPINVAPATQPAAAQVVVAAQQDTVMSEPVISVQVDEPALPYQTYEEDVNKAVNPVIEGVELETTQTVEYEQRLILDWSALPEPVQFVFIALDGKIIGTTHEPQPNYETGDFDLVEGQKMIIGQAPNNIRRTALLTLTQREEVEPEPEVSVLMPVNDDVVEAAPVEEELPYYHNWGKNRRRKERNRLRSQGKPVPADL